MKMFVVNRKFLVLPVLLASFVFLGCGEDNSQPFIAAIPDTTLDVGTVATVAVNITDANVDDTHTIRATSNDTAIATVSTRDTTLTIVGVGGGITTITVSVTDDSGQENAEATPVAFQVTGRYRAEDVNRDGVVDLNDLVYISERYGHRENSSADVNEDGIINIDDLILVAAVIEGAAAAPSLRLQRPEGLTTAMVTQWLAEAKLTSQNTPAYQRGIGFLERLLAVLPPR